MQRHSFFVEKAGYISRCERIANEILMYFRSQRKSASDVSLSDYIETGKDGNALSLIDVICTEEDLFEQLNTNEMYRTLYEAVDRCLTPREKMIIVLRYGLGDQKPRTQREIAAICGISRSYVSRRRYCKRCPNTLALKMQGCSGIGYFWILLCRWKAIDVFE